jgi:LysM repeat protein
MSLNNSNSQPIAKQTGPGRRPESGPERRPESGPARGPMSGPERRPERRPEYRPERRPYRPYYPYVPSYPYTPPVATCPYGASPYTVQPGDTLYMISNRFGISVQDIIAVNPYINFSTPLQIGQFICLPIG